MSLPVGYSKRSFLEFDVDLDVRAIHDEYAAIPREAWLSSYWGKSHCSVAMFLLRGGTTGTEDDFWTEDEAVDHPHLAAMPAVRALLDGPFGKARYAFFFRMRPNGVTLRHRDRAPVWQTMYRIHVPLVTNEGAFLISGERSQHLSVGRAWTFDNGDEHGVVNGPEERVHLIFDVPFNPVLMAQVDRARHHAGVRVPDHLARIEARDAFATASYPGDREVQSLIERHRREGLSDEQISSRLNEAGIPPKQVFSADRWTPALITAWPTDQRSAKQLG